MKLRYFYSWSQRLGVLDGGTLFKWLHIGTGREGHVNRLSRVVSGESMGVAELLVLSLQRFIDARLYSASCGTHSQWWDPKRWWCAFRQMVEAMKSVMLRFGITRYTRR